jgi:hypothetical protein
MKKIPIHKNKLIFEKKFNHFVHVGIRPRLWYLFLDVQLSRELTYM